jgi:N-acyl homoserine lactone hydrolase
VFTKAELVVQRSHYELARNGHARSQIVREHWDLPAVRDGHALPRSRFRLVDGDTVLLPGHRTIGDERSCARTSIITGAPP